MQIGELGLGCSEGEGGDEGESGLRVSLRLPFNGDVVPTVGCGAVRVWFFLLLFVGYVCVCICFSSYSSSSFASSCVYS